MTLATPDSTLTAIRKKIRRLTASSSEQSLTTATIDQAINTFYQNDFPYGIKLDQMRDVYTFFTSPNVDRYPLNVNFNQGIRAPVYFEGIKGFFFKDRGQYFNMWPRWPTQSQPFTGDGTQNQVTFTVQAVPFLSQSFVLGGVDASNNPIRIADDGNGNLYLQTPNAQTSDPVITSSYPGMKNLNTGNPGDNIQTLCGSVNYVSGAVVINFSDINVTPLDGNVFNLWVSQYTVGRPYSLLFWNNEFTIRPVPDKVYKVEIETYLTPVQFLEENSYPILNQWWQYIAYGAAMEIMRERQDLEGVQNMMEGFKRQEALVLERQGIEEIGQRNTTIFSSTVQQQGWNQGFGFPY